MVNEEKEKILQLAKECPSDIYEIVKEFFKEQKYNSKILLEKLDRNSKTKTGYPLAYDAVIRNMIPVLKLYFCINMDIDGNIDFIHIDYRKTPLTLAVSENRKKVFEFLLESGADIRKKDNSHMTPLQHALGRGRTEIALILTNKIYNVCLKDEIELIKFLLKYSCELEVEFFYSPLLFYSSTINKEAFKMVLSVSPIECLYDLHSHFYETLLDLIVIWGNKGMLKVALEHGVDLNYKRDFFRNPLHRAIVDCPKMIPILVKNGARIHSDNDDFDEDHVSLLRDLGSCRFFKGTKSARKHGVDLYKKVDINDSELHHLCRFGDKDNYKSFLLALERGADVNVNDSILKFALEDDLLERYDKTPIIKILVSIIVKMIENKDFVSSANIQCLSNEEIRDFAKECKQEIYRLKEKKIIDNFTIVYYDFLTSDLKKLTSLARNKEITKKRLENYQEEFPIYAQHLKRGFERSIWRWRKVEQTYQNLGIKKFPLLVFEQICGYLNDHELTMSKYYFQLLGKSLLSK